MYRCLAILLLFFCSAGFACAQDLRGDSIDLRSYRLSVNLTDFTTKTLYGEALIGIKAKASVNLITLDLLELPVDSVKVNATTASFTYNDTLLHIQFPVTLNTGDSSTLQVFYHGQPVQPAGDFGGFYWTSTHAFNIGVSFLSDQHCFGRVWFPCFDNFTERSFYEFFITTKDIHKAFCNGLLADVNTTGNTKIWHWKFAEEIPSYLASVAVSDYLTLTDTVHGVNGVVPIELAARGSDTILLKNRFMHLHDAFHIQEQHWGPYQWERIGYCIVPFTAGAMEHATNIAFMQPLLNAALRDAENTMAHELSHHWFGDLVTCNDASEMWLNEGWATYNEYLFTEKLYGDSAYAKIIRDNHEYVLHQAHQRDGAYLALSGVPSVNTYGPTVYRKGGDMIHTLRYYMGDSLFFHCVTEYLVAYAGKTANTAQLRNYLSQCSGKNLADYFNDYIYQPGFAHFSLEQVIFREIFPLEPPDAFITIRQRMNHNNQFYNNVPVQLSFFDAYWNRVDRIITVSGECTKFGDQIYGLHGWPVYVAVDFDEQLQDAITDEWKFITKTGTYNFGTAKMTLTVTTASDSNLVRVEHNWIRPEPMQNKIPGLHLLNGRYWTVDGIFRTDFNARGRIDYNGSDASLDGPYITKSEDSLVVMYRANANSEWAMADSFTINAEGNKFDRTGFATIYNMQKGQYCFAIWNASQTDTTTAEAACLFNSVNDLKAEENGFSFYPNPTHEGITINLYKPGFERVELYSLEGKKLGEKKIIGTQNSIQYNLTNVAAGCYLITLVTSNGNRSTKKLVKQ